jgi:hypothetical protein
VADELRETAAKLELLVPTLREVQRARFQGGDEEGLLKAADVIVTVVDAALVVLYGAAKLPSGGPSLLVLEAHC